MQVAGLILAGGLGKRMNGLDKGLEILDGKPLIEYIVDSISLDILKLFISVNRNQNKYSHYGHILVDDKKLGSSLGPLGGVASGISAWSGEWLVTVPCDSPFLSYHLIKRLITEARAKNASLAVAAINGKREPVFMALKTMLLSNLKTYLIAKNRKVRLWQDLIGAIEVDCSDFPLTFFNINTFEQMKLARDILYSNQSLKS